jgi:hypothetical protein
MLEAFGHTMLTPTRLYMDNDSAILMAEKDGSFARNKHVLIRKNYTREGIRDKIVVPAHKDTTKKPADMLTKAKVSRLLKVDMLAAGMTEIKK